MFGGAGVHQQMARDRIPGPEHGPPARLTGGWNAQIGTPLGPAARQIGMRDRFGCIEIQQVNVASLGLLAEPFQADAAARDGVGVLPAVQRVARPTPAEPRLRKSTESQPADTRTPSWHSISAHSRGKVQGRSWASS